MKTEKITSYEVAIGKPIEVNSEDATSLLSDLIATNFAIQTSLGCDDCKFGTGARGARIKPNSLTEIPSRMVIYCKKAGHLNSKCVDVEVTVDALLKEVNQKK